MQFSDPMPREGLFLALFFYTFCFQNTDFNLNLDSKYYLFLFFFILIIFWESYFVNVDRNLQFICTFSFLFFLLARMGKARACQLVKLEKKLF